MISKDSPAMAPIQDVVYTVLAVWGKGTPRQRVEFWRGGMSDTRHHAVADWNEYLRDFVSSADDPLPELIDVVRVSLLTTGELVAERI